MKTSAVLLISCPDRKGLVATVSDFIFRHGGNILHTDEHTDADSSWFLMRVEFDPAEFEGGEEGQKIPVLSDSRQKSRVAHTLAYSKFRGNVKQ